MPSPNPVFVAIDRPDREGALQLVGALRGAVGGVKLGLEFWAAQGPAGIRDIAALGLPVFLDIKLHDIPNTVAGALRGLGTPHPAFVTLHASGGRAMLTAAAEAVAAMGPDRPRLLAVTVLTSLDSADLRELGIEADAPGQAIRLARLAIDCGIDGIVCSPREITAVREACGPACVIATPGIRPAGSEQGDQKRTATPAEAIRAGADILVIGRPITMAAEPQAAARAIQAALEEGR